MKRSELFWQLFCLRSLTSKTVQEKPLPLFSLWEGGRVRWAVILPMLLLDGAQRIERNFRPVWEIASALHGMCRHMAKWELLHI